MNRISRTVQFLIVAVVVLVALTGVAALTAPDGSATGAKAAERRPVERSSLLCPAPSNSDLAETTYTSFTPGPSSAGSSSGTGGSAELHTAVSGTGTGSQPPGGGTGEDTGGTTGGDDDTEQGDGTDQGDDTDQDGDGQGKGDKNDKDANRRQSGSTKPVLSAKAPGKPVEAEASASEPPALIGFADGALAPGWTVQQTTQISAGDDRGLSSVNCSAPDTDFWFPGASTLDTRSDYIHLINPDDSAAVADLELYGKHGAVKSDVAEGIQIRPRQSVAVLLSTLTERPETNLTVHVSVRSGRVAAAMQAADQQQGGDWMAPVAIPAASLVLPGIPKDATAVRLVAFAPGQEDADLGIKLASPTGPITPAGHETLHVKSGMTAAVDLGDITRGEAGSLLLTSSDDVPVIAALRVMRGKEGARESAFIPATPAIGERSTVADNRARGTTLSLVAPGGTARVRVTSSAGTEKGAPVTKTYTVKGGTTLDIHPSVPSGLKGSYAVTVEPLSGGPVYASRMLEVPEGGVPMFTVQTMPDDRGMVRVPTAHQDLSVVQR